MKMIVSLSLFAGLAFASSLLPKLEHTLMVVMVVILIGLGLAGLAYWLFDHLSVWWECVRPDNPAPVGEPHPSAPQRGPGR